MRSRLRNSEADTRTSLGDIIEIENDLYVVTGINPLELTDIEHYGGKETRDY